MGLGFRVGVRVRCDAGARQESAAVEPDEVRGLGHLVQLVIVLVLVAERYSLKYKRGNRISHRMVSSRRTVSSITTNTRAAARRTSGAMPGTCSCTKPTR